MSMVGRESGSSPWTKEVARIDFDEGKWVRKEQGATKVFDMDSFLVKEKAQARSSKLNLHIPTVDQFESSLKKKVVKQHCVECKAEPLKRSSLLRSNIVGSNELPNPVL